jgi:hypothetical protein
LTGSLRSSRITPLRAEIGGIRGGTEVAMAVLTRGAETTQGVGNGAASRLTTGRRSAVPNGRAVLGGLLVAAAVLIMAFLGAAMWVGFNTIWDDAEENIGDQVQQIGDDTGE